MPAAYPYAGAGEPSSVRISSANGGFETRLLALDWRERFRSSQNNMPTRARARGTPTAQPIITGSLDFLSESVELGALVEAGDVGVTTSVRTTVTIPADPEESDVSTLVVGVASLLGEGVVFGAAVED